MAHFVPFCLFSVDWRWLNKQISKEFWSVEFLIGTWFSNLDSLTNLFILQNVSSKSLQNCISGAAKDFISRTELIYGLYFFQCFINGMVIVQTEMCYLFHALKYCNVQEKRVIKSSLLCSKVRSVTLKWQIRMQLFQQSEEESRNCLYFFSSTLTLAICKCK